MTAEHDLVITSGGGPLEARRFVALLAARLEDRAAALGLVVGDVVLSDDSDDAPRSIALRLRGDAMRLADELGTHALVHRSPQRGRAARKRWFVAVQLHRAVDRAALAPPPRDELAITACRAGGPGGQHVNKTSSAVRVCHLPTGVAIRCATERSQHANLARALARLAEVLRDRDVARADAARADRRRAHYTVERGRAVRTYELDRGALVERAA